MPWPSLSHSMAEYAPVDAPRYLPAPRGGCLTERAGRPGVINSVIRVGDLHIGVQTEETEIHKAVEDAFRTNLVADPAAPAIFAIYRTSTNLPGSRPLYHLHQGCLRIFTARTVEDAIRSLAAHLDDRLPREPPPERSLEIAAVAVVGNGTARLIPWIAPLHLPRLQPWCRRVGLELLPGRFVLIDADRRALIPRQYRTLSGQDHGGGEQQGTRRTAFEAFSSSDWTITDWVFVDRKSTAGSRSMSPAQAVARGIRCAYPSRSPAETLALLATFLRQVTAFVVPRHESVLELIVKLEDRPGLGHA